MLIKEELPACPVATTVQLIGNKWKLLILRNLLDRPWRFNELKKDLDGISQKVLTDSLRSMESDVIITRTVYPEVTPRVEYPPVRLGGKHAVHSGVYEGMGDLLSGVCKKRFSLSLQAMKGAFSPLVGAFPAPSSSAAPSVLAERSPLVMHWNWQR